MADISVFIITEEKWQSMSEADRLKAITQGDLTLDQMHKIHDEGSGELKKAVGEYLANSANRLQESFKKLSDPPVPRLSPIAEAYVDESALEPIQIIKEYNSESQDLDELGLHKKSTFNRDLPERTAASERFGGPLALVMIDLDKFKPINDTHGHAAGDEVLQSVARTIKQAVGIKGKSYRYGGDEFSVLLPNYTADEAAALAERIRREIEGSHIGSKGLRVTASFGVAELPTHATDAGDLLTLADVALYEAKDLRCNLVRIIGEPKPVASMPRVTARRQPDASNLTEKELEKIRTDHFKGRHAFCPRDGSVLRTEEFQRDDQRTPSLVISCPFCGLSDRIEGAV